MLLRLYIKNYAIIDELDILFSGNLNVITGETGAGKSILLGALSLILGERADLDVLADKKNKAVIEGVFRLPDTPEIRLFFLGEELDHEKETLIRREISPQGKSRAFVNDTPVNLQQLSRLSILLVDLHQQFDTLQLNRADFQLQVLDALAENKTLRDSYEIKYAAYQDSKKRWDALREQQERATRELDYDQFLFDELEEAGFLEDELESLESEQQTLTHAEDLKTALDGALQMLEEDESALVPLLRQAQGKLESIASFHQDLPGLVARIRSSGIELQDISAEISNLNSHVSFDEERIHLIAQRLDTGYRLLKKHGVRTTGELLGVRETLRQKLDEVSHADREMAQLEKEKEVQLEEARELAIQLTRRRKTQLNPLVKKTNSLLASVDMPGAALRVEMTQGDLNESGQDQVLFLFDANKSGHFQPIRKVASGGELSRLMLCIKSLVARSVSLPTLIFDEIDSGISGEAARQVGNIMQDLARSHQVICITHQPQIAGKADTHFEVFKQETQGRIHTDIRLLTTEQRVNTIARMLSGEKPGKAALANARELMED